MNDSADRAKRAAAAARGWLGTPFVHQASARGLGCDCLGLLRGVWREVVGPEPLPVPPYSRGWPGASADGEILHEALARVFVGASGEPAREGQVLLFRTGRLLPAGHVAILASPGRLIHARDPLGVVEEPLAPWLRRLSAVFDWPEDG
jgi:NlpC/P60 family putative phage cell wall peptidase